MKKAHHILAYDENFTNNELQVDAKVLVGEPRETMVPYIRQISARAKVLDGTSCDDEKVWFGEFEDRITRVVRKALVLKIRLVGGDCEHEFLWPNHGDVFDASSMQHTVRAYPDP